MSNALSWLEMCCSPLGLPSLLLPKRMAELAGPLCPNTILVEHTLDDCIEDRLNPGGFWNYGEEHFMGDTKRPAGRNFQRELGRRILFALLSRLGIALDKL